MNICRIFFWKYWMGITSKTREPAVMPLIMVPKRIDPCESDRWTPCEATKNAISWPGVMSLHAIKWPPKNSVDNTILNYIGIILESLEIVWKNIISLFPKNIQTK